eukprot:m.1639817 g.1639817  ORF g.1639817 m.1639817 type:complete len:74 (-) comp38024_c0_seq1:784-1005(-)
MLVFDAFLLIHVPSLVYFDVRCEVTSVRSAPPHFLETVHVACTCVLKLTHVTHFRSLASSFKISYHLVCCTRL